MTPPVLLGRPGDLVPQDGRVDAYTTRIGGTPVLPEGVGAMPDLRCQHCKEPLVLLLQVGGGVHAQPVCRACEGPQEWRGQEGFAGSSVL